MSDSFEKARILFDLSKYDRAAAVWVEELSKNPDYALAHCQLALCQLALGQMDLAMRSAREGVRLRPDWVDPYHILARCHIVLNQWPQAQQAIHEALRIDPQDLIALQLAAKIAAYFQQWLEASDLLDRALAIDPTELESRNLKTYVLVQSGNYALAQSINDETLNHHPENGYAQMMMGLKMWELGRGKEAEARLDEALRLKPNSEFFRRAKIQFVKSKSRFLSIIVGLDNIKFFDSLFIEFFVFLLMSFVFIESFNYRKEPLKIGELWIPFIFIILFADFGSWIAEPLSNFFLAPPQKHLLNPNEILLSRWCAGLLALSLLGIPLTVILPRDWWALGGFAFLLPMLTLFPVMGFLTLAPTKKRWIVYPLTVLMGLLFLFGGALLIWAVVVSPTVSLGFLDRDFDARIWGIGLWEMIPLVAVPMGYLIKKTD